MPTLAGSTVQWASPGSVGAARAAGERISKHHITRHSMGLGIKHCFYWCRVSGVVSPPTCPLPFTLLLGPLKAA